MKQILMGFFCGLISLNAIAALDDSEASIRRDHAQFVNRKMKTSKLTQHNNKSTTALFSVHEFEADNIRIHEFTNSSGLVFAIAWLGPKRPDLSILLGKHFDRFSSGEKAQVHNLATRHHPAAVEFENVKVERGGVPGNMWGRAYLVDQLPTGVQAKDLQ